MQYNVLQKLQKIDTPYYFYDKNIIRKNIETLCKHFSCCNAKIFFAVKANTSLSILKIVKEKGLGAEVVSPGELFICLKAGFVPKRILYNNIARKEEDVIYAIKKGVTFYNFEAIDQAVLLETCARRLKKKISIFARINPGIFSETHPHLSTGAPSSKFGIDASMVGEIITTLKKFHYANFVGIHSHIGSQILTPSPFVKGKRKVAELIDYFQKRGIKVSYINLGGGFGVPYHPRERELNFSSIVHSYSEMAREYEVKILLEPGRFIVSNAGFIVTRVISVKQRKNLPLYIIDAGMTENPRPALYNAYHHIESLVKQSSIKRKARIVGPLCENTDEFGIFSLPDLGIGDILLIHNCGAYTRTMASNYNGRVLPAEYLLNNHTLKMIRKRQQLNSLIDDEIY